MKRLFIRLSSLGDVILCASALEVVPESRTTRNVTSNPTASLSSPFENHWVVADEFGDLLEGHPRISRLWRFKRRSGFGAWIALARQLHSEKFDEVIDLHRSLRSTILISLLRSWSLLQMKMPPRVGRLSKPRVSLWGYFWLKKYWPKALRPRALSSRAALLVGGRGDEHANFTHLVVRGADVFEKEPFLNERLKNRSFVCLMPGSLWPGKRFSVARFAEIAEQLREVVVVLGTNRDAESVELVKLLEQRGVSFVSGVGKWDLSQTAAVLARARAYLGNDTGLAHLAEAVGTPAHVVFGPTMPDMGFGPWRPESHSYGAELGCRPCGKDGRYCYRSTKFLCLQKIDSSQILRGLGRDPGTVKARGL